ncbi:hypothetical protein EV178_003916 [Coemansia sp. RSA 1646]|nr:hypothetical protein EV178_003916 [Coemansia sp. RSA 1646]KAJ2210598.1 hypothetical protein EV179_006122 [Coemansia sp. RSA 487]
MSASELQQLEKLPPLRGQERIAALEELTGTTVQDNDGSDKAVIIVSIVCLALIFVFMVYTWLNRNYRPIRAKTLKLCTMMYMASVLWVVGDFQMNGMVRIDGAWKQCRVWVVWVRILCSYVFSGLIMLRFFALDRIFNRGKPYSGRAVYVPAGLLVALFLAYCLTCQLVPEHDITVYINYYQICDVNNTFRYASVGLMWVPWTVSLVLAFRLRNIQSSFNERYETMATLAMAYMTLIKTTAIHAAHPFYLFQKRYRQAETLIDVITSSTIILIMLAYPVYQCIFHRTEYEKHWVRKLRLDGQAARYAVGAELGSMDQTAFSEHGNYNQKDPLDTIRMLSQNGKTLTANFITQPPNSYRAPNVDFSMLEEMQSDPSLDISEPRYPRRII